ncbi:hypothetical protein S2091_3483 [Solimicrobium silvestre]|uniref:Uncharacterized protein n=2 Tax=Solimicrobium silvestre TaxID=2099400 RepID=A0A2S9GVK0_9BURK|nr:hypothetical protein S2091_3483 [Solimicrobium silvestre]
MDGYYRSIRSADCFVDSTKSEICQVEQGLNIKHRSKDSYFIWIHTEGNYGHICSYKEIGKLLGSSLVVDKDNCRVVIQVDNDVAKIRVTGESCEANYCGANVDLNVDGLKRK